MREAEVPGSVVSHKCGSYWGHNGYVEEVNAREIMKVESPELDK